MRQIEDLLRRHIGLDAGAVGPSLIERAVRLRMRQHRVADAEAYRRLLATSRHEFEQLIESVLVTETWFFRDREPFNIFTQIVRQENQTRPKAGALRVLSLPCSTGEEPYSMVMALLDAGVADAGSTIHAVDISANALAQAERAVYGKNSFRGRDVDFRDRYFRTTKEGFALLPQVRQRVRFERGNILEAGFLAGGAQYDIIFCRNLLIYFDRATQVIALAKLHELLSDNGVLFVGPAELPLAVASGFVSIGLPMAFACQKPNPDPAARENHRRWLGQGMTVEPPRRRHSRATAATAVAIDAPGELEVARQHAEAGRLAEAAAICNSHLAREGASAEAYFLLGLVKDAASDSAAISCYRKALYLDPKHHEALVHLSMALEKSGDLNAARLYRRRAERARPKA